MCATKGIIHSIINNDTTAVLLQPCHITRSPAMPPFFRTLWSLLLLLSSLHFTLLLNSLSVQIHNKVKLLL